MMRRIFHFDKSSIRRIIKVLPMRKMILMKVMRQFRSRHLRADLLIEEQLPT